MQNGVTFVNRDGGNVKDQGMYVVSLSMRNTRTPSHAQGLHRFTHAAAGWSCIATAHQALMTPMSCQLMPDSRGTEICAGPRSVTTAVYQHRA